MGCENSQIADITPHEVQQLPLDNSSNVQQPSKINNKPTPNNQKNLHDKENSQPQELPSSKRQIKERNGSKKLSELKNKGVRSECQLEESPVIIDTTNLPKENIALEGSKKTQNKRQSKQLSVRDIEKPEQAPVGPSSKSIEAPVESPQKTGVEEFPISKVLEEDNKEEEKQEAPKEEVLKEDEKQVAPEEKQERCSTPESQKLELTQFNLDHFSKTQRGKEVHHQQVDNYLNQLFSYQIEVVNAIIARLEERQKKRYEEDC